MKKISLTTAIVFLFTAVMGVAFVQASAITLSNQNSTAQIDPSSQAGMYSWTVGGNDILYQQWFWYRVGQTGGQQSIDAIGAPAVTQYSPGSAQIEYVSGSFKIDITYSLMGGTLNSGTADMGELIRITNLTSSPLAFHFFEYSDFDLMGPNSDSAALTNANTITQKNQVLSVAETVVTPAPNHWEIAYHPALLEQLNGGATSLTDTNNTTIGDITWGFEWDVTIAPGSSFLISKDKLVSGVPEPGILILLGCGLIGALAVRRKF